MNGLTATILRQTLQSWNWTILGRISSSHHFLYSKIVEGLQKTDRMERPQKSSCGSCWNASHYKNCNYACSPDTWIMKDLGTWIMWQDIWQGSSRPWRVGESFEQLSDVCEHILDLQYKCTQVLHHQYRYLTWYPHLLPAFPMHVQSRLVEVELGYGTFQSQSWWLGEWVRSLI